MLPSSPDHRAAAARPSMMIDWIVAEPAHVRRRRIAIYRQAGICIGWRSAWPPEVADF
jgi:hypothetical protein